MTPSIVAVSLCLLGVTQTSGLRAASSPHKGGTGNGWIFCADPSFDGTATDIRIPKIVHQTYKSATLPPRLEVYHNSWKHYLPDWEHRMWLDEDNRNLVKEHYPWFLETYDSYDQNIKRVDAARLFMLHRFGGVYADTDIEAVQDPLPLFQGKSELMFFAQSTITCGHTAKVIMPQNKETVGVIPNALMASVPGHPFWIFYAMKLVAARKEQLVMWATGPSRLTEALGDYQTKYPQAHVSIFTKDYWAPFKWEDRGCETAGDCTAVYPDAFLISHWTGTWNHCEKGTCLQNDTLAKHWHHSGDKVQF